MIGEFQGFLHSPDLLIIKTLRLYSRPDSKWSIVSDVVGL